MRFVTAGVVLALLSSATPGAASEGAPFTFDRPALPVGVLPQAMAFADIDGDGRDDVLAGVGNDVCCPTSVGVSLMRGRPDGFFAPAATIVTSAIPLAVQPVDVDGDGLVDVAASLKDEDPGEREAAILFGQNGSLRDQTDPGLPDARSFVFGRFGTGQPTGAVLVTDVAVEHWRQTGGTFVFGSQLADVPGLVLGADVDGDAAEEVVVATDAGLTLFRNLAPAATVALPEVVGLEAADVTGDGVDEILAVTVTGVIRALDAALQTVRTVQSKVTGAQAAAGDLDGDGAADIVSGGATSSLSVTFAGGGQAIVKLTSSATDLAVRDMNADGIDDILALEPSTSIVEVVEATGGGGFAPQRRVEPTAPANWLTEATDLNNDGKRDLVTSPLDPYFFAIGAGYHVTAFLGDGTGDFTQSARLPMEAAISGMVVGDFNGDDNQDIVVGDYYAGTSVFLGNGDGTFLPRVPIASCVFNDGVTTGDYNADGIDDVAFVCRTAIFQDHVAVMLGTPAGFVRGPSTPLSRNAQSFVLRTGDINGDGRDDIAVGAIDHNAPCVPPSLTCLLFARQDRPIAYFLGLGNGLFEPTSRDYITGTSMVDFALADVNGDGRDDFVTPLTFVDEVQVALGKADGSIGTPTRVAAYDYPLGVRVGDVTGDGHADLVMSHGPAILTVTPGRGDGTFADSTPYTARAPIYDPVIAKIDLDDDLDVLGIESTGVELFGVG